MQFAQGLTAAVRPKGHHDSRAIPGCRLGYILVRWASGRNLRWLAQPPQHRRRSGWVHVRLPLRGIRNCLPLFDLVAAATNKDLHATGVEGFLPTRSPVCKCQAPGMADVAIVRPERAHLQAEQVARVRTSTDHVGVRPGLRDHLSTGLRLGQL